MRLTSGLFLSATSLLRAPAPQLNDVLAAKAALLTRIKNERTLSDASKALIEALSGAPQEEAAAAGSSWSGEFDLLSYDALAGQLEDVRLRPLSGVARLTSDAIELELDVQHRSGDNVGFTLSGSVAPAEDGTAALKVELKDGEVFARDVGDIGEMMETESRLRACLPPLVRATMALAYVDDDLLIARCTEHEETAPPKHWKYSRFPSWMGSSEEALFVLSRRGAEDAWSPERTESRKRGGAEELEELSDTIRQLDRETLGGYTRGDYLGGQ